MELLWTPEGWYTIDEDGTVTHIPFVCVRLIVDENSDEALDKDMIDKIIANWWENRLVRQGGAMIEHPGE